MPFAPFDEPERHHQLVVHEPLRARSLTTTTTPVRGHSIRPRHHIPRWVWWLVSLIALITLWWVSMDFRGLIIVLGVFWLFAIGAHPAVHMGRAVHDIFDGDNND